MGRHPRNHGNVPPDLRLSGRALPAIEYKKENEDVESTIDEPVDPSLGAFLLPSPSGPVNKSRWGVLRSLRRATTVGLTRSSTNRSDLVDSKGALGMTTLFEPSEPMVDFIFIHGLGGGSRKTWTSKNDPSTYWPKEWLPYETGFRHARIHTFGYDSDWTKPQQSSLTIHDFGQALLADLSNSPALKKNGNTPIVFVAHSMGGLITKKAYLLAMRDPIYREIADRIHSLYFLATPHRGADSSSFVNAYLSMSLNTGQKAFVKELVPGNGTLQVINDEFRHVCEKVHLWSFFEGLPTTAGPTSIHVVEKESATMGLPGEHTQYLHADHRHVCKFSSHNDSNYNILLRCFNTTIEEIEKERNQAGLEQHKAEIKLITRAFDISQLPEADLLAVLDKLHRGSCLWLTESPIFQEWLDCELPSGYTDLQALVSPRDAVKLTPRYLWLNGPPGSGKSVAAGHVIDYLETNNLDYAYFFFKNHATVTLTQMLFSLAFQMASSNFQVRQMFLAMVEAGEGIDSQADTALVWNNIFMGRLFKLAFAQPQYWVIDGLDECPARSTASLVSMLARVDPSVPLRVFVTSRANSHVERMLNQEKVARVEMHTAESGSLWDIGCYVQARLSPSMIREFNDEMGGGADLVREIKEKSNGIFLWASIIIDRLDEAHSIESMRDTLDVVPTEMSGMYRSILKTVTESSGAPLAHCILKWVVCAREPLTTDELREAVYLDISQRLRTADRYAQICANLVVVDSHNRVQVMHHTVREFLTGRESDTYISRPAGHARLAEVCLQILNGKRFAPPRPRRGGGAAIPSSSSSSSSSVSSYPTASGLGALMPRNNGSATYLVAASASGSGSRKEANSTALCEYAVHHFSHHLVHCLQGEGDGDGDATARLLPLLAAFVSSNVVTWIEHVALTGKLHPLMKTIKNLKVYLDQQAQGCSLMDADYHVVSRFVDDLARLVAMFGPRLLDVPSAIFTLIPLVCPTTSVVFEKLGRQARQRVVCAFNDDWEERLSSTWFPSRVMSLDAVGEGIAGAEPLFAVGLADGTVSLNSGSSFEPLATLQHGEPVRHVVFGNISHALCSCGLKTVKVWSARQVLMWEASLPDQPVNDSVRFSLDDLHLYVPLKTGEVLTYDVQKGTQLESLPVIEEERPGSDAGLNVVPDTGSRDGSLAAGARKQQRNTPTIMKIYPTVELAVWAARSGHLQLSYYNDDDDDEEERSDGVDTFIKEGYEEEGSLPPQVLDIACNGLADEALLAVAYQDGDLVTLDPWTLRLRGVYDLQVHVLASSLDGRTLAAGDSEGFITVFAFDTLRPLYRISSLQERIVGIVFASNSRFYDIRSDTCNVWEPSALIRKSIADDSSSENEGGDLYFDPASSATPLTDCCSPDEGDPRQQQQQQLLQVLVKCTRSFEEDRYITTLAQAGEGSHFVFCGREDGSITVHDTGSGAVCGEFRYHARMVDIHRIEWGAQTKVLFSVDASRRCVVTRLEPPAAAAGLNGRAPPIWKVQAHVLDFRARDPVTQALISPDGNLFLVSSLVGEEMRDLAGKVCQATGYSRGTARWIQHPIDMNRLLLLDGDRLHIFRWEGLTRETPEAGVAIVLPLRDVPDGLTLSSGMVPIPSPAFPKSSSNKGGSNKAHNLKNHSNAWETLHGSSLLVRTMEVSSPDGGAPQIAFLTLDLAGITTGSGLPEEEEEEKEEEVDDDDVADTSNMPTPTMASFAGTLSAPASPVLDTLASIDNVLEAHDNMLEVHDEPRQYVLATCAVRQLAGGSSVKASLGVDQRSGHYLFLCTRNWVCSVNLKAGVSVNAAPNGNGGGSRTSNYSNGSTAAAAPAANANLTNPGVNNSSNGRNVDSATSLLGTSTPASPVRTPTTATLLPTAAATANRGDPGGSYTRHFFIPSMWQEGGGEGVVVRVVNKNSVAFANRDQVVVMQAFLDCEFRTPFEDPAAAAALVKVTPPSPAPYHQQSAQSRPPGGRRWW